MSELTMTTAAEPDGAPRIAVLDILRGVAILGILFMNINDMGNSLYASFDDIRHLGWSATDQVAWWLREVLANGTARCLLEMLFGAGMVILTERVATRAGEWVVLRRYYARNLILFAFGLVHIFILLWPGDILHTYGLAALVAVLFRRLRARWLLLIGLVLALMQVVGVGVNVEMVRYNQTAYPQVIAKQQAHQPLTKADKAVIKAHDERAKSRAKNDLKSRQDIAAEDTARTGTFMTWAAMQWHVIIEIESYGLEALWVWEAASLMLIGAALFKLGILQGARSRRFYGWMVLAGYGVGIPLRVWGAFAMTAPEGTGPHIAPAFSEIAREAMTLGACRADQSAGDDGVRSEIAAAVRRGGADRAVGLYRAVAGLPVGTVSAVHARPVRQDDVGAVNGDGVPRQCRLADRRELVGAPVRHRAGGVGVALAGGGPGAAVAQAAARGERAGRRARAGLTPLRQPFRPR